MTDETQSVCKHCHKSDSAGDHFRVGVTYTPLRGKFHKFEPVSTGEPPQRYWLILYEDAGLAQQFELFTDESAARKRHQALLLNWNCHLFTEAAPEPPEPFKSDNPWHLFHHLWTKAVGTTGYVKQEWRDLEAVLVRAKVA